MNKTVIQLSKIMLKIYIKTLPRALTILSLFSLGFLILKVTLLNSIPEIFEYGHELGVMVEGILLSVVASYIFYLIVVHYKETKEKASLIPYVIEWCEGLVASSRNVISVVFDAKDVSYDYKLLSRDDIAQVVSNLDPYQENISLYQKGKLTRHIGNWYGFFSSLQELDLIKLERIKNSKYLLEAELIEIVTDIAECSYYMMLPHYQAAIKQGHKPGSPFQNDGADIFTYYQHCLRLRKYLDKIIPIYGRKS